MRRSYARMSAILESLGAIVITILIVVPAAGPDDSDCNPLLTQQESRWLAEHDGRIRYAPCPDFAPVDFVDEDGIHRGITADYVELLEQKLRFKFKKVYCQSWEEMIQKARAKEIDVISSIQETPERREYLEFTRPYVTIPVAIIVRKEVEGSLDPRRMHGMRVAMVKGYASLDFVKREYPDLLIDPVQTNPEGLKMVSFGRADAMIENLAVATYYIQKLGITNLRVAGFIDFKWNLRFGSRNDWPVLSQILDKGLASVSSGEAHSIYTKWISLGGESVFASRKFWTSIAVALSVVLLTIGGILTWNRTLRRQVEQRNAQLQQEFAERERAQAALRDSEERYRTLFEGSSDAIMVVRPEGEIVDANPSAGELFGVPRPELLGADILQFYCDPAERATLREVVDTKGFTRNHEWNIKRRDGQERKCLMASSAWRDEQGTLLGYLTIAHDITELERIEEQFRQAQKMEAIGTLAGGIAHDFNNLLTAMMGYSHMLLSELPEDSVYHARLSQILLAAEKACALTRQLLAFSRKQILDFRVLDLNEVIENIGKILQRVIGEHIGLTTALDPDLGCVEADPTQIEQILMNLAVNARDAMPNGGYLSIETRDVYLDETYTQNHPEVLPGPYVMLAVTDTGIGMDADTRSRIFDPFFTTKDKGAGTGLGLSTVYGIVKQHRGHIAVYSEAGRGTTFKVYLSRIEKPVDRIDKTEVTWPDHRGNETVLLVEDEDVVRVLASEVLEMLGYHVLEAWDPEEALKLAEQFGGTIHLLLTDVVLPQMDGRSLYNRLSSLRPHMKVLYVSGYTEDFIVHHGVLEKDVHFLSKPFTLDKLAAKVREVLNLQR